MEYVWNTCSTVDNSGPNAATIFFEFQQVPVEVVVGPISGRVAVQNDRVPGTANDFRIDLVTRLDKLR